MSHVVAFINDESMALEGCERDAYEQLFDVTFRGQSMTLTIGHIPEDDLANYIDADVVRCRFTVERDEAAGKAQG